MQALPMECRRADCGLMVLQFSGDADAFLPDMRWSLQAAVDVAADRPFLIALRNVSGGTIEDAMQVHNLLALTNRVCNRGIALWTNGCTGPLAGLIPALLWSYATPEAQVGCCGADAGDMDELRPLFIDAVRELKPGANRATLVRLIRDATFTGQELLEQSVCPTAADENAAAAEFLESWRELGPHPMVAALSVGG
jgi:hypothetical protein